MPDTFDTFQTISPTVFHQYTTYLQNDTVATDDQAYTQCIFDTVHFSDIRNCQFTSCRFVNCTFDGVLLHGVHFHTCSFSRNNRFERTHHTRVWYNECQIDSASYVESTFLNTLWTEGRIKNSNFAKAVFEEVKLAKMQLDQVNLQQTDWHHIVGEGILLSCCDCQHTHWRQITLSASLYTCTFNNATLEQVHNSSDIVNGCTWEQATLRDTDLFGMSHPPFICKVCGKRSDSQLKSNPGLRICVHCANVQCYSTPNTKVVGKVTKQRWPSFSIEFEVDNEPRVDFAGENPIVLLNHGFHRCSDGSVGSEYKSPIYQNMLSFSHVLPVLDTLHAYVTNRCGTHIHVGFTNSQKHILREHFTRIFGPLVEELINNEPATRYFWGRYFSEEYARATTAYSSRERYVWLNLTNEKLPTIEFRLPKFVNAAQYRHVIVFVRSLSRYLDKKLTPAPSSSEAYDRLGQRVLYRYRQALAHRSDAERLDENEHRKEEVHV